MRQQEHAVDQAPRGAAARRQQLGQLTLWSGLLTIGLALFAVGCDHRQREDRRLAEAHLREQEKQYRLVTGSVPAMIAYIDCRHRVLFHNRAVEEWLDLPAERIDNHHLSEVLGADIYMSILPEIERALQGERVDCERKRYARNGRALVDTILDRGPSISRSTDSNGRCAAGFFAMSVGVWDRNIQTDEVLYSKRYKEMLGCGGRNREPA